MNPIEANPLAVFATVFVLSSLAGLAALLRSSKPLTPRMIAATLLYYGLMGLGLTLSWWEWFEASRNVWVLVGLSIFLGLCSLSAADVLHFVLKKLRILIAETKWAASGSL